VYFAEVGNNSGAGRLQQRGSDRCRHLDCDKAIGGEQIVLTALVDHAKITIPFSLVIGQDGVDLVALEGYLVSLVANTDRAPASRACHWEMAVLKAHGVSHEWRKGSYKDLTPEGQQRLRGINLHWHDLRHEYVSRLVERNVPLAQVRDLLGHASIVTTERDDNQRLEALQAAVARLEAGKAFDAITDATDRLSRIFQVPAERSLAEDSDGSKEISRSN
jgi:Phage integrase family